MRKKRNASIVFKRVDVVSLYAFHSERTALLDDVEEVEVALGGAFGGAIGCGLTSWRERDVKDGGI